VWGSLWPTLFPYGIGMFEDRIHRTQGLGLRHINLKSHVKHYLSLTDQRFQKHTSFMFVMMNIIQRRTSSYQCRLAFKRSWFPKVTSALDKINTLGLSELISKLKKDPHVKPDNECETAAFELLRYVQYVSNDISGSTAEVHAMWEEIRSVIRSRGLPQLYVTINPADFHNPIAQVLAGRDINLDEFFDKVEGNTEAFIRARTFAENPVVAARFFKLIIDAFTGILLGHDRPDKVGIFGKVDSYYGVVE
ncbi:hypothetical protein M422DRAFT_97732, partial [Sphaerobolus stellatus SS14]